MGLRTLMAALLGLSATGCGDGKSYLLVTVRSARALALDRLDVGLANGGMTATVQVTQGGRFDIPPDRTFALQIDPARSGEVAVTIDAIDGERPAAHGTGKATLEPGHTVSLTVDLISGEPFDEDLKMTDGLGASDDVRPADLTVLDGPPPDRSAVDFTVPPDLALLPDLRVVDLQGHCGNQIKDGDETDGDCGGRDCAPCAFRRGCLVDRDCQSGSCWNARCSAVTLSLGGASSLTSGALPANSQSVAVGDLNGDGRADVVCGKQKAPSILTTWLGDGNGNFVIGGQFQATSPAAVAVGQIDGTAPLDLVFLDDANNVITAMVGLGNGTTFANPSTWATTAVGPVFLEAGDVDGDGKLDVVTANGSNDISLLRGNGNGGFLAAQRYGALGTPYAVALGDFDSDGRLDAITGNASSQKITILLNDKMGGFKPGYQFQIGGQPTHLAVGDLDGDRKPDLAIVRSDDALSLVFSDGNGGVARSSAFAMPVNSTPRYVVARDFNLDGKLDLAVSLYGGNAIVVLQGRGDGTFNAPIQVATLSPLYLASADFNGDGLPDLAAGNANTNTCSVILNTSK